MPPSKIKDLAVDTPLKQDANYVFDTADRAYLDDQARAAQQHLVDSVLTGVHASWYTLDASSAAIVPGDWLCLVGQGNVTKVTALALGSAGGATAGCALAAASPGAMVHVGMAGVLPPGVTGLATSTTGFARVNKTTARTEKVDSYSEGDIPVGSVAATGYLTLVRSSSATVVGAGGGQIFTLDAGSASVVTGDVVCSANSSANSLLVTKATAAALLAAGSALGIATEAASPGDAVSVAVAGLTAAHTVTGLGNGASALAVVDGSAHVARSALPHGGEYIIGQADGKGNVVVAPTAFIATSPLHVFNVKAYGAKGDYDNATAIGTDDYAAIRAAIDAMSAAATSLGAILYFPPGNYRLSQAVHITRQMVIQGASGAGSRAASTIFPDLGVTAFIIDGFFSSPDTGRGEYSVIKDLAIRCHRKPVAVVRNTGYQSTFIAGTSERSVVYPNRQPTWQASHHYDLDDTVQAVSPDGHWFRCIQDGTTGGTEPTWATGYGQGGLTTDGGVLWQRQLTPRMRSKQANNRPACLAYLCTTTGTTHATNEPAWPQIVGDTVTDGSCVWTAVEANGIFGLARFKLENVYIDQMASDAVHIYGNNSDTPSTNANNFRIDYCALQSCGGAGLCVSGIDANVGAITGVDCSHNALYGFEDRSFLGNYYFGCHVDDNDQGGYLSFSLVAANAFIACYSESGQPPSIANGPALFASGLQAAKWQPNNVGQILNDGFGFSSPFAVRNDKGLVGIVINPAGVNSSGMSAQAFSAQGGSSFTLAYNVGADEWRWSNGTNDLMGYTGSSLAGQNGAGYLRLNTGAIIGDAGREAQVFCDERAMTRGQTRTVGDLWLSYSTGGGTALGGYLGMVCVRSGVGATVWTANTPYSLNALAKPSVDNTYYYKATTGGTSDLTTEPTWRTDTTPFTDGSVTWTRQSTTALFGQVGEIVDPAVSTTAQQHTIWASNPVVDGAKSTGATTNGTTLVLHSFALPDATTTVVYADVTAYEATGTGSPDAAEFQLKGVWRRSGGAPVVVKAAAVVDSNPNANGGAWTAVLALNGNAVEVQVTGATGKNISWSCVRQGQEGT